MDTFTQMVVSNLSELRGFEALEPSVSLLKNMGFVEQNLVFKNTGNFCICFKSDSKEIHIVTSKGVLRVSIFTESKGCSCPLQSVDILKSLCDKYIGSVA